MAWHGMAWHGMAWHGMVSWRASSLTLSLAPHGRVLPRLSTTATATRDDILSDIELRLFLRRALLLRRHGPCLEPAGQGMGWWRVGGAQGWHNGAKAAVATGACGGVEWIVLARVGRSEHLPGGGVRIETYRSLRSLASEGALAGRERAPPQLGRSRAAENSKWSKGFCARAINLGLNGPRKGTPLGGC